jgi:hypothetical protein
VWLVGWLVGCGWCLVGWLDFQYNMLDFLISTHGLKVENVNFELAL